jgi:hypothetical protein
MDAEFCKVLEYMPDDKRLLVRACIGCHLASGHGHHRQLAVVRNLAQR